MPDEDEESTRGDQKPKQDLPGSVSDQNAEEQPSPSGGGERRENPDRAGGGDSQSGGESSEGSQSTGSPDSAG